MNASPPSNRPIALFVAQDPATLDDTRAFFTDLKVPTLTATTGVSAWDMLSRNSVGLIVVGAVTTGLNFQEFLLLLRNDNEFVKIPLVIDGRKLSTDQKAFARHLGYGFWIEENMSTQETKECVEKMYGRSFIVAGLLAASAQVEMNVKKLLHGTNILLKVSQQSGEFLRRLETAHPDLVLIDLRYKTEPVETVLKTLNSDTEWKTLPRVTIAPPQHPLIKASTTLGCASNLDEEASRSDAKKAIQLALNKPFFDLPFPIVKTFEDHASTSSKAA